VAAVTNGVAQWSAKAAVRPSIVALVAVAAMSGACARREAPPADAAAATQGALPELLRFVPDSADISLGQVVRVLAIGRRFDPTNNTVEFGPVPLRRVAANATGDTIAFTVPLERLSGGGAPPQPVDPGTYNVRIVTAVGRTATLPFRVLTRTAPEGRPNSSELR